MVTFYIYPADEFSKELQKEYEGRMKATKMITDLQKDKSKSFIF